MIAVAVVALLLAIARGRLADPAFRYRVLDDHHSFKDALANYVENGDTFEYVKQILGEGMHRKERPWIEIQMLAMNDEDFNDQYPDGIEIDDTFIAYWDFPSQYVLQFRDGRVVNLDTARLRQHYGTQRQKTDEP